MTSLYLYINAFIYLVFAVWCLLKPTETANFSGLNFLNSSGKVEYLTVYGGMELGFCIFFALAGFIPSLHFAGITFSLCLYGGLILVRCISALLVSNLKPATYFVGGLELVLGICALLLFLQELKHGKAQ